MSETPPTVSLGGKVYPLSWGALAKVRYASLPQEIRDLGAPISDATLVWASIAVKPNPFLTWEHVAEHFSKENIADIRNALDVIFTPASEEKKSSLTNEPLTDSASA